MATIKELRANFTANAQGVKATVDSMTNSLKGLKKESDRVGSSLGKNIGGGLQKADSVIQRTSTKIGNGLQNISDKSINVGTNIKHIGSEMQSVGGGLTKWITTPALVATSAIGGLVASFGWGRLVGLDTAQAKLKGLGYEAEDVERISDQVVTAIDGGMTTMAEGVDIAAGALAAGVEEGAELEHYIKLVGDAAVGANRPVNEMAMIFNRVQGGGKLMTQELNMIEDGMPGFSQAMADHMGVSMEAFREMVTAGEVSSEDFLTVMDDFAGGMASAYADSWQGMLANTKAYIGIIGENLLGGVFEKSKESIAEFIEFLKSPAVQEWAVRAGESIGEWFSKIVDWVKRGIQWFMDLSSTTQKLIGIIALIGTAIGPVLLAMGTVLSVIGSMITNFGAITGVLATAFKWLGEKGVGGALKALASRFSFLLGPVGITIGVITTLATAFMILYKRSETFRNFVDSLVDKFKLAINWVKQFATAIKGLFSGDAFNVDGAIDLLYSLGLTEGQIAFIFNAVDRIKSAYNGLKTGVMNAIRPIKDFFLGQFHGIRSWWESDGSMILEAIGNVFEFTFDLIKSVAKIGLNTVIEAFKIFAPIVMGIWNTLWPKIEFIAKTAWNTIELIIGTAMDIIKGIISAAAAILTGDWSRLGEVLADTARSIWNRVTSFFRKLSSDAMDLFDSMFSGIGRIFGNIATWLFQKSVEIKDGVSNRISGMVTSVVGFFTRLGINVNSKVTQIKDWVVGKFTETKDGASNQISNLVSSVTGFFGRMWDGIKGIVANIRDGVVNRLTQLRDMAMVPINALLSRILPPFQKIYDGASKRMRQLKDIVVFIFEMMRSTVVGVVTTLRDRMIRGFQRIYNRVSEIVGNIYNWVSNKFKQLRDTVISVLTRMSEVTLSIYTGIWNFITRIVGNIYNWVSNKFRQLRDAIVNIVTAIYDRISRIFRNIYNTISRIVGDVYNWVSNKFRQLRDEIVSIVTRIYDRISSLFTRIYNKVRDITTNIRNKVVSIWEALRDRVVDVVSNLYDRIRRFFTNIYNNVRDKMRDIKNRVVDLATDMKDGAIDKFNDLSDGARDMMNKIGDWIDEKREMVVKKAKNLGVGIANGAIGGFNKMIGGINDVADLLGYKGDLIDKIPTFDYYSKGTAYHGGGHAVVGDKGFGNSAVARSGNRQREIVEFPDGREMLFNEPTLIKDAPRGMKVRNNRETEKRLDAGSGSEKSNGLFKKIGDFTKDTVSAGMNKVGKVFNTVKDIGSDIWDYVTDPASLVRDMIGNIDFGFDLPTGALEIAQLGIKKLTSVVTDYIKGLFENASGVGDGSHILGKAITARFGFYPPHIARQLGMTRHYGLDTAHVFDKLLSPINGVITRIWNDYGGGKSIQAKSGNMNWWFMHMSSIAKKVGDRIRTGDLLGITGNTGHNTTGPHLHTQLMRNGVGNRFAIDPLPYLQGAKGYASGGITDGNPELAFLNEERFKESIISHNPARRQSQEAIWQRTGEMLGFDGSQNEIIAELREANALTKEVIEAIYVTEGGDIYLDKEKVGKRVASVVKRHNDYKERTRKKSNKGGKR